MPPTQEAPHEALRYLRRIHPPRWRERHDPGGHGAAPRSSSSLPLVEAGVAVELGEARRVTGGSEALLCPERKEALAHERLTEEAHGSIPQLSIEVDED